MSFNNFDNDFCLIKGNFDPNKFEEFTSTHPQESGQWVAGFTSPNNVFFMKANFAKKEVSFFTLKKKYGLGFPIGGFFHYEQDAVHHAVTTSQFAFMPRSFRIKINEELLDEFISNNTISSNLSLDIYLGLIFRKVYYPGIPKVYPHECDKNSVYECNVNYPKTTNVRKGSYFLSDKTYILPNAGFDFSQLPVHLVGYGFDNTLLSTATFNYDLATQRSAVSAGLFAGIVLNYGIQTTAALKFKQLLREDIMQFTTWIRPLTFAHGFPSIYTEQRLNLPIYMYSPFYYSGTLGGLLTEMGLMSDYATQNNVIIEQYYSFMFTYISNIFYNPANQVTDLAWGSMKVLSFFFYAGYPLINIQSFDTGQLLTYINLPFNDLSDSILFPYFDDYKIVSGDNEPRYAFSIFPEDYSMFEGQLFVNCRPFNLFEDNDHFYYAHNSSVVVDSIDLSINNKENNITACDTIPKTVGTLDWKKLLEQNSIHYTKSAMDDYMYFAEGKFKGCGLVLDSAFDKPVLMSVASTQIIDTLNQRIIAAIKNLDDSCIQLDVYAIIQVGPGEELPENPYKSLSAYSDYGFFHYKKYDYNRSFFQSKYGVYRNFIITEHTFEQHIIKYTIKFNKMSVLIRPLINYQANDIKSVDGDLFSGFTVNVQQGSNKDKLVLKLEKFDLVAECPSLLFSTSYFGIGCFPHLEFFNQDTLIFYNDSELLEYSISQGELTNLAIPFKSYNNEKDPKLVIIPQSDLITLYKAVKRIHQS